jgi:hypothetical protein
VRSPDEYIGFVASGKTKALVIAEASKQARSCSRSLLQSRRKADEHMPSSLNYTLQLYRANSHWLLSNYTSTGTCHTRPCNFPHSPAVTSCGKSLAKASCRPAMHQSCQLVTVISLGIRTDPGPPELCCINASYKFHQDAQGVPSSYAMPVAMSGQDSGSSILSFNIKTPVTAVVFFCVLVLHSHRVQVSTCCLQRSAHVGPMLTHNHSTSSTSAAGRVGSRPFMILRKTASQNHLRAQRIK